MTLTNRMSLWTIYLLSYIGLDWVSYFYAVQPLAITPWNPPPALSLILLLRYGLKNWPLLFVAAFLAELIVRGMPAPWYFAVLSSGMLTLVYASSAVMLQRFARLDLSFRRLRDLGWFSIVVVPGSLIAAAAYVTVYTYAEIIPTSHWVDNIVRFWLGDLVGIMVVAPLFLLLLSEKAALAWLKPDIEKLLQLASIGIAIWVIFGLEVFDNQKFFYPLFLPLIWIAMRQGMIGAAVAILLTQLGLILTMLWTGQALATMIDAQYMMLALTITGLFLGVAVSERQHAQHALNMREIEMNQVLRIMGASEMTSAVAHELNQPLAAIANYVRACQLMVENAPQVHPQLKETMEKTVREVTRAGEAVHRLREFFRFGLFQRNHHSVYILLRDLAKTVDSQRALYNVGFSFRLASGLPEVYVDQIQIDIVLRNLLLNAIQALASVEGVRREIVLEAYEAVSTRGWIEIAVVDNGPGVANELLPGLFYAFSTSKTDGMGLGLAISRSIIEAHGGKLWLDKSVTTGARFCFTLPTEETRDANLTTG